ncbi:MAG: tRNA adenosine(34) deaminase TadA [Proteobacteria bacterium]|nr:tRNA adenosine(34) deaminase TadA [Pseudomonadota bacterium]
MISPASLQPLSNGNNSEIDVDDLHWLRVSLQLARRAEQESEVPVGAVVVYQNQLIGQGWNQPIQRCDPTAHAEIIALRQAAEHIKNYRLLDTTLYVTLEPCAMCLGAMVQARIKKLVFGAWDVKAGAVRSVFQILEAPQLNHKIFWQGGILEEESATILKSFFQKKRTRDSRKSCVLCGNG